MENCNHENGTYRTDCFYEEGHLVEYKTCCEDCKVSLQIFSYGSIEDLIETDNEDV